MRIFLFDFGGCSGHPSHENLGFLIGNHSVRPRVRIPPFRSILIPFLVVLRRFSKETLRRPDEVPQDTLPGYSSSLVQGLVSGPPFLMIHVSSLVGFGSW